MPVSGLVDGAWLAGLCAIFFVVMAVLLVWLVVMADVDLGKVGLGLGCILVVGLT